MTKDELINLALDATNDAELSSNEIPAIDLYVDQIINLISGKLESGSERYRSRVLTKTMINNYSKDGVISPVKGKKYTREQLIQILFIYSLKNTLSIGEIKRLLGGAYATEGFDSAQLVGLYDTHEDIKERTRERSIEFLCNDIIEGMSLSPDNDTDYIALVCALVSTSAHLKNIAQAMIDARFPEPVEEESEKEDKEKKKEEKDKAKEEKKEEKDKAKEEKKEEKDKAKEEKDKAKEKKKKDKDAETAE